MSLNRRIDRHLAAGLTRGEAEQQAQLELEVEAGRATTPESGQKGAQPLSPGEKTAKSKRASAQLRDDEPWPGDSEGLAF